MECIDALVRNTLEHDNLSSLCFAPMLQKAWNLNLVREVNRCASATLKSLTVNFRCAALVRSGLVMKNDLCWTRASCRQGQLTGCELSFAGPSRRWTCCHWRRLSSLSWNSWS